VRDQPAQPRGCRDLDEFAAQVETQRTPTITDLFGAPTTFRNTELILDNTICKKVEDLGFECMLGEGADRLLGWRSPQVPYRPKGCKRLKLLLRSYSLSDDIAFRFSNRKWPSFPLFADTYAGWLHDVPPPAQFLGLFMDYETFGEHQGEQTGILEFMRHLPRAGAAGPSFRSHASPGRRRTRRRSELDIPTAGVVGRRRAQPLGLARQPDAARGAARRSTRCAPTCWRSQKQRPDLLAAWRKFTTSDHVYYVATKHHSDAEVHEYFSPYDTPHAAFVTLMTATTWITCVRSE
jgi:alpha-amylase